MKAVDTSADIQLDETGINTLYPQLFSELTALTVGSDRDFLMRFPRFVAELAHDLLLEEQWMETICFDGLREHRAQHAELLGLLHHAQSRLLAGDHNLARKLVPLLTPWFTHHIARMDVGWATIAKNAALQEAAMLQAA